MRPLAVFALLQGAMTAEQITYNGGYQAWTYTLNTISQVAIHESCNASESILIRKGFADLRILAQVALDHLHAYGDASSITRRWFGKGNLAQVVGWYSGLLHGDKQGMLFRCDNPDGNCAIQDWYGHWRGANATLETVICPITYTGRFPLEQVCMGAHALRDLSPGYFTGADFIHRLLHYPGLNGGGRINETADTYEACLSLAENNPTEAVANMHSLQRFAVEVFAYELVVPGVGCSGHKDGIYAQVLADRTSKTVAESLEKPDNGCKPLQGRWQCPAGVAEPMRPPPAS